MDVLLVICFYYLLFLSAQDEFLLTAGFAQLTLCRILCMYKQTDLLCHPAVILYYYTTSVHQNDSKVPQVEKWRVKEIWLDVYDGVFAWKMHVFLLCVENLSFPKALLAVNSIKYVTMGMLYDGKISEVNKYYFHTWMLVS